jgi:hypothetical protein
MTNAEWLERYAKNESRWGGTKSRELLVCAAELRTLYALAAACENSPDEAIQAKLEAFKKLKGEQ